jgi:hypothetical protein
MLETITPPAMLRRTSSFLAWLYTVCMVRGISHQATGVDESCNQEHLKQMVVPLLCKRFKQREQRHMFNL